MSNLLCPVCQRPSREWLHAGLLIDRCGHCRGVWLDCGAVERLQAAPGAGTTPPPLAYPPAARRR